MLTLLMNVLTSVFAFVLVMVACLVVCAPICVLYLLWMEGQLGEVFRDYFGPPRPQIRVIGPGGPDDVMFEGEEVGVKSMLHQIPYSEKRGWRIEKMEPLPPKILNLLR